MHTSRKLVCMFSPSGVMEGCTQPQTTQKSRQLTMQGSFPLKLKLCERIVHARNCPSSKSLVLSLPWLSSTTWAPPCGVALYESAHPIIPGSRNPFPGPSPLIQFSPASAPPRPKVLTVTGVLYVWCLRIAHRCPILSIGPVAVMLLGTFASFRHAVTIHMTASPSSARGVNAVHCVVFFLGAGSR